MKKASGDAVWPVAEISWGRAVTKLLRTTWSDYFVGLGNAGYLKFIVHRS